MVIRTYLYIQSVALEPGMIFYTQNAALRTRSISVKTEYGYETKSRSLYTECDLDNLTKVRPLFTLSHRGTDNSWLLIVFSANNIDQSSVTFMQLKAG